MAVGRLASGMLETDLASYMGAAGLVAIGLSMWLKGFIDRFAPPANGGPREICSVRVSSLGLVLLILKEPLRADTDLSGTIDAKEAVSLGVALALNNIANGVPAGLMGLPILLTSLCMGLFSLLSISLGWHVGRLAGSRLLSWRAGMLSGAILILLGLYRVLAG